MFITGLPAILSSVSPSPSLVPSLPLDPFPSTNIVSEPPFDPAYAGGALRTEEERRLHPVTAAALPCLPCTARTTTRTSAKESLHPTDYRRPVPYWHSTSIVLTPLPGYPVPEEHHGISPIPVCTTHVWGLFRNITVPAGLSAAGGGGKNLGVKKLVLGRNPTRGQTRNSPASSATTSTCTRTTTTTTSTSTTPTRRPPNLPKEESIPKTAVQLW
eukprot:2143409-Rhodomonas_salina.1